MKQTKFNVSGAIPTPTDITPSIQAQVPVPNTTVTNLAAANQSRRYISINNPSASSVFLTFDGSVPDASSYELAAGQVIWFDMGSDGSMVRGQIQAFQTSGGAIDVSVLELEA